MNYNRAENKKVLGMMDTLREENTTLRTELADTQEKLSSATGMVAWMKEDIWAWHADHCECQNGPPGETTCETRERLISPTEIANSHDSRIRGEERAKVWESALMGADKDNAEQTYSFLESKAEEARKQLESSVGGEVE